jgi:cephalosporin hydroxylase
MADGFLHKYFLNNPSKRLHKWTHYFDIYERHFERFRAKSSVMLEIGVAGGGSLAMWRQYLGDGCKIIGLDINPECKMHEAEGIDIFIGSQNDPGILQSIKTKYPYIDIVLDDGNHSSPYMIASFNHLYDHVQPRGVYMVEDTHANYWPDWGGGVKAPGTFMEFTKEKIDEINAVHTRNAIPVSQFTLSTDCIAIYDSIVVFEKRRQGNRQAPVTMGLSELPPK